MSFVHGTTYTASARMSTSSSSHRRSPSIESTSSTFSTLSSSSTSSNSGLSLRERRGVTFQLSSSELLPVGVQALELTGHLGSRLNGIPRGRRALPKPIAIFDPTSVMGEVGVKIPNARDFGMGEDGWTVVAL